MNSLSRRNALSIGGAFIGATFFDFIFPHKALAAVSSTTPPNIWVTAFGPTTIYKDGKRDLSAITVDQESVVFFWDQNQDFFSVKVPFLPHSIIQNPARPNSLTLIPKFGTTACDLDLNTLQVKSVWTSEPGCRFFGHGFYSTDGKKLYITQANANGERSFISIYQSAQEPRKADSEILCKHPYSHDCVLSLSGNEILACGSPGPVMRIRYSDHKLIDTITTGPIGPSHLHQTSDGYIIYGGLIHSKSNQPESSVLGAIGPDNIAIPINIPLADSAHFKGEALSLTAIEKTGLAIATLWATNSIFAFEYRTGKLIKRIESPSPMGVYISEDQKHFFATSKESRSIIKYDIESFDKVDSWHPPDAQAWSSHVFKIKGTISEYKKVTSKST